MFAEVRYDAFDCNGVAEEGLGIGNDGVDAQSFGNLNFIGVLAAAGGGEHHAETSHGREKNSFFHHL